MTKPVLALDFDDLIYPFMAGFVPFVNSYHGTNLTLADFRTFNFEEVWGGTRDEAIERVLHYFEQIEGHPEPVEGAIAAVEQLRERYDLVIVTAREERLRKSTESWLEAHLPVHFEQVHLCGTYATDPNTPKRTKLEVCREIDVVGLVDDSLHNVTELAAAGRRGILFGNYPWNEADELPAGVIRAPDWNAVLEELMEDTQ